MTDTTVTDQAPKPPEEAPAGDAAAAAEAPSAVRTEAQILLDRYQANSERLIALHRRLLQVRGAIVATPAPSGGVPAGAERPPKKTAFFAGLSVFAAAEETVIAALAKDVEDLAQLFDCEAPDARQA